MPLREHLDRMEADVARIKGNEDMLLSPALTSGNPAIVDQGPLSQAQPTASDEGGHFTPATESVSKCSEEAV